MNENKTASIMMILLVLLFVSGFFIVPSWKSYLLGAFVMYLMSSIVLNKYKMEMEILINRGL